MWVRIYKSASGLARQSRAGSLVFAGKQLARAGQAAALATNGRQPSTLAAGCIPHILITAAFDGHRFVRHIQQNTERRRSCVNGRNSALLYGL